MAPVAPGEPKPSPKPQPMGGNMPMIFLFTTCTLCFLFILWRRASALRAVISHQLKTMASTSGAIRLSEDGGPPASAFLEDDYDDDNEGLSLDVQVDEAVAAPPTSRPGATRARPLSVNYRRIVVVAAIYPMYSFVSTDNACTLLLYLSWHEQHVWSPRRHLASGATHLASIELIRLFQGKSVLQSGSVRRQRNEAGVLLQPFQIARLYADGRIGFASIAAAVHLAPATMTCPQDRTFGPASTCRDLDFTLDFEQTILSLSPDVVFIAIAALRLAFLSRQSRCTNNSKLSYALLAIKCLASLFVLATTLVLLVVARHERILSVSLGLAAPIVQILAAAMLLLVVMVKHTQSITPSTLVIVYTFFKCIFSAAIMRSSLRIGEPHRTVVSLALVVASYFGLCLAEILGKSRAILKKDVAPVSATSFLSRVTFYWLFPLKWRGHNRKLTIADCGSIPAEMGARASTNPLRAVLLSVTRTGKHYLVRASFKAMPLLFLSPIPPRILLIFATFAQPLLTTRMITYVAEPPQSQSSERGWALVGGFVATYGLITLMTAVYWEKVFNSTVLYRGALVGNIYSKTLRLSSASSREVGGGVASTYMSVDVERVSAGLETMHEMWAAIVQIILGVALLWTQATWTAILPLVITFILITTAGRVSKGVGAAQKQWLSSTDKRVKFLTSIIQNFLAIKLLHYEDIVARRAAYLRAQEMKGASSFYANISLTGALTSTSWGACTLVVLGPYAALAARGHAPLDPSRLFTIVSIINIMAPPLTLLGSGLPQILAALTSLARIEKYLLLEEKENAFDAENGSTFVLKDASFAWAADKPTFLGPLSLSLAPKQLTICVGPVASGKTLFLLSLLGEAHLNDGSLATPESPLRVAYAPQDPLIVPGTLRENILFGNDFDASWYHTVIRACGLAPDLGQLNGGDGIYLAEKAPTLSGGQRQRVSLARAVYSQAPWMLLDDPFSSLDSHTEQHVFRSLFGDSGLLRGRSVVLVTHNTRHLARGDCVVVFESGSIKHHGTLDEVIASGFQYTRDEVGTHTVVAEEELAPKSVERPGHVAQKEPPEEPIAESSLGWTPYKFYMTMAGISGSFAVIIFLAATGSTRLGLLIYQQQWSNHAGERVDVWIGGYTALVVFYFIAVGLSMWGYTLVISRQLGHNIHATELRGLLGAAPTFMTTTTPGRIVNRFSQDIFMSDLEIPWNVTNIIMPGTVLIGFVVFICVSTPWLALTIPFFGGMYYLMISFYMRTAKQFQALGAASKSPLYTQFSSTISGLVTIRAIGAQGHFERQNEVILHQSQIPFFYRFASVRLLRTFLALISFLIATGLSVLSIGLRHSTNPSTLGLALVSVTNMASQLNNLLMNLTGLENASIALSRIHEIASLPIEPDPASQSQIEGPTRGNVEFKDVSLRYGEGLPRVVDHVSFKAEAGQRIGICGRTGSGKSSLLLALFRGLEPSLLDGSVLLDDVDTSSMSLATLRGSLGLVSQSPLIWNGPLRHNLDPDETLTDKEIWLALERVGLADAVGELSDKLETLLCLARILLRGGKVVVLDEASSSLDAETDRRMRNIIWTDLSGSTIIAVAHRIDTILDYDLVLVMENGSVVERGTPGSLLAQTESRFAQLARSQGVLA
uniref:P-loop containing nucleoside triphosphate hydrolase protein n=1 Tax=Mycena chlorophos TaxID=658473 RepID=A0ABQ0L9Z9_MYCCL|nr:predicted protein [Mycena chlorophos]